MTKREALTKIEESAGSLFTKEDVTKLINELSETSSEELIDDVISLINSYDFAYNIHHSSFEISGDAEVVIDQLDIDLDPLIKSIRNIQS